MISQSEGATQAQNRRTASATCTLLISSDVQVVKSSPLPYQRGTYLWFCFVLFCSYSPKSTSYNNCTPRNYLLGDILIYLQGCIYFKDHLFLLYTIFVLYSKCSISILSRGICRFILLLTRCLLSSIMSKRWILTYYLFFNTSAYLF